jgi:DNA replication protein DnaC
MSDRLLAGTNVPRQFKRTQFDDYDPKRRKGTRTILHQIEDWEPSVKRPAMLLQGPPDVGKTMLSSAFVNSYHEDLRFTGNPSKQARTILCQQFYPVYFIQLAALIDLHLRLFQLSRDIDRNVVHDADEYLEIDKLLQDFKTSVKVLVIDDVGKEHRTSSGFAEDAFDLLVRTRHNAGLTTVYTTNLPLRAWAGCYSESMQSIIERSSLVLNF